LLVIAVLFIFLRLPSLFEPYWYDDEGIYLTIGQALNRGVKLYSQIHDNKPPLLYLMAAFSKTVFGFRLLLFFVMIPTVYFFHKLAKKFVSGGLQKIATFVFIILSCIPLLEGNIANAEIFMLLPTLAAFTIYITAAKPLHYLVSGLLLGLSFMIKAPAALEVGTIIFWETSCLLDQKAFKREIIPFAKRVALLLGGFFVPLVLCSLYFLANGGFNYFIYASLLQNFGYLSSWSIGTHSGSALSGGLALRLLVLFVLLAVGYISKVSKKIDAKTFMITSWFAFSLFGSLLSGRPYPHYLIEIIPPLSILVVHLFGKYKTFTKLIIVLYFAVFAGAIVKYKFYFYRTVSYYANFYSYVLGFKSKDEFNNYFGWHVPENYQISEFLKNNTVPDDKIFIWGDRASIYALSNRPPQARFTTAYHIVDFNGYDETIEKFKIDLPKVIIYYNMPGRDFPQLDLFIKKYYYLAVKIGDALIYRSR
jgi:hypothetical protein